MPETRTFTPAELQACAEREVKFRRRVFAHRVAQNKMRQAEADREILMMVAIAEHFAEAAKADRLI
jgi:hypothetical protein